MVGERGQGEEEGDEDGGFSCEASSDFFWCLDWDDSEGGEGDEDEDEGEDTD